MGVLAQNPVKVVEYYQDVSLPLEYATQVLDSNHTGKISIRQITKDHLITPLFVSSSVMRTFFLTKVKFGNNTIEAGYIDIDKQLKPLLIKRYENITAFNPSKCNYIGVCPVLWRSLLNLVPNLGVIGNVSKSTGILILNGENDSLTPVQQAFLLQQRLTDVNHPDHTLITYPDLGHAFYPSSQWKIGVGPIQQYVLADLYAWLEAHSGLSRSNITTSTASAMEANTNSLNTNTTSP